MSAGGEKSICNTLHNGKVKDGHNAGLKHWQEYWGLSLPAHTDLVAAAERTGELRNQLNHKQHVITRARVTSGIDDMCAILMTLSLPSDSLGARRQRLADVNGAVTVSADASGAMRIPFKDPRNHLVGHAPLIADVALRLQTSPHCIKALYGESGAGKTAAAIAIAYEAQGALPVQLFMEGSSAAALRIELARYTRLHVSGVDENSDDGKLVAAARQHLAHSPGWLLLVDDVGRDLQGVLDLLPVSNTGTPAGHVLLTSQRRSVWPAMVHTTEVGMLLTDESIVLLGQGVKKQCVDAAVLADPAINLRGYVENDLGNLALDVALLKDALKGIADVTAAAAIVAQWRAAAGREP